ncbi:anti-sigma factor [Ilumatobacter sp.]|uniref:anti-sigma factor n=1 Tax=Ilumatobacter sp. TaxID=1967498 RepID=UPI003C5AB256
MSDDAPTNELEELRRLGRSASVEPVEWETPPPGLWGRIADAAFADDDADSDQGDVRIEAADEVQRSQAVTDHVAVSEEADDAMAPPTAAAIPLSGRRRPSSGRWLLAAAAALIVVVTAGAVVWMRPSVDSSVVASVELERLGDTGTGSAELVDDGGSLRLRVVTDGVEAPEGFTEVWLINTELTELVSLGPIREDGSYDLPPGLDPADFPIVDLSFEPLDGNPEHSGDSVLRGELTF